MDVLVTGAAGFIGFHVTYELLKRDYSVIGIDNLNNYYEPKLKKDRLQVLENYQKKNNCQFKFLKVDLQGRESINDIFKAFKPKVVINLAAQAGVRYSIENPSAYINSNIVGFSNLIEQSKIHNVSNFIYASSSSVYGGNKLMPFSELHVVDHPVSLYAATKKSNELIAHCYSHLFNLPTIGLRFFTVYGPWGRPDMALFLFTKSIINGDSIDIYNEGNMIRDFTYIDDIVESILRLINKPAEPSNKFDEKVPDSSSSWAPYRIFNIGNSQPTHLMDYINALEKELGLKAKKNFMPIQPGDVEATSADTKKLIDWIDFKPSTKIAEGINKFVSWYREYYDC